MIDGISSWLVLARVHYPLSIYSAQPHDWVRKKRKIKMGLLRIVSPRVSVKDEEVRRVLSNYPCLSSWRRVKTIPTQITRLATDSATSSSTAPATRAENTNLLAGVIFSRTEEWEVNYKPEMEPWRYGAGPINTIITWHSRVSAAGPVERCPQHQWLTPWPMLLMNTHKHYWISVWTIFMVQWHIAFRKTGKWCLLQRQRLWH